MPVSIDNCAHEVLEVTPLIMRAIRAEMRRQRGFDLSVPQFRTLAYLNYYQGASLSDAAEFIGLTLPSMSKLVDGLVARQLVLRELAANDRRRVMLALTAAGQATFQAARAATQTFLAQRLAELPAEERAVVTEAMQILHPLFTPQQELESEPDGRSNNGIKNDP
ncbi:MAG: MarR family transcriptional regulator [Anaerolineae bacterium]|nr:MarR family transcriptional regulator [Anaerolineae bacterium]